MYMYSWCIAIRFALSCDRNTHLGERQATKFRPLSNIFQKPIYPIVCVDYLQCASSNHHDSQADCMKKPVKDMGYIEIVMAHLAQRGSCAWYPFFKSPRACRSGDFCQLRRTT